MKLCQIHRWRKAKWHLSASTPAVASLIAQLVKNPPAMQETLVQFLGREDPLKKGLGYPFQYSWASLVAQLVKDPPAMQETWFRSLGWEDPLEKGKATHSSFWPRELHGLYSSWGHKESDTTEQLSLSLLSLLSLMSSGTWARYFRCLALVADKTGVKVVSAS